MLGRVVTRRKGDAAAPPQLVLRFAVVTAVCLGIGAAGILAVVRHLDVRQAERNAAQHAQFVGESLLDRDLRGSDLTDPVTGRRLGQLDRLFEQHVLSRGSLRVTLVRADGLVTYSTDHRLIGRRPAERERITGALDGTITSEVGSLPDPSAPEQQLKVLSSYVPLGIPGGRRGVAAIYQDYAPIAAAARGAFLPVAGILEAVLILLFVLLLPMLARVSRRIRRQMEQIEHQAYYDDLTGLPNRALFHKRLSDALSAGRRDTRPVAVLLLDLDRFREINDTLGHRLGDELLQQVVERLRDELDNDAVLARLGGDEFGIMLPYVAAESAHAQAARLREALRRPFVLDRVPLGVDASLGIAIFPGDGEEGDTLLRRADVAMYIAKGRRTGVAVYEPELDTNDPAQLALMPELRSAIERGELVLYYQPKAAMRAGTICGAEALVRWQHPSRGLLPPSAFVPYAEHTGLHRELSRFVLETVVRDLGVLGGLGLRIPLAANLSALDLLDLTLPEEIASLLEREGVDARLLEIELTETAIMADHPRARQVLDALGDLGTTLAIDDFGTGYSSLTHLKSLPIDTIKIDKSFVLGMATNSSDATIVRSTIDLGHNLGLTVVAEGVESKELWHELRDLGCDIAQGFYLAEPRPLDEAMSLLLSSTQTGMPPRRVRTARAPQSTAT